jgi:ABC-2 type transport system ATP-binding protein
MATAIEVHNLERHFGSIRAVDGISFTVEEGEVFGFLGPNGAGKTTTVRLLNGVLAPTAGTARVLGLDPPTQGCELRRHTGVLTETPSLYERLTARDNLGTFGALYGVPEAALPARVEALLDQFDLLGRADDKVGGYSKGMKQRLALARALLHEPPLLFLDEPTAALDPEAAHQVTDLIEQLSHQGGRTVFLCTHNLDEAERLCDRVAVLNQGRVLAVGSLEELSRTLWKGLWVDFALEQDLGPAVLDEVRTLPGVRQVEAAAGTLAVQVEAQGAIPDLVAALAGRGARIVRVNPRRHSLEDVYFEIQKQPSGGNDERA